MKKHNERFRVPTTAFDQRSYIGFDVCEYPDSDKILIAPSFDVFKKTSSTDYFEGEKDIVEKWHSLMSDPRCSKF